MRRDWRALTIPDPSVPPQSRPPCPALPRPGAGLPSQSRSRADTPKMAAPIPASAGPRHVAAVSRHCISRRAAHPQGRPRGGGGADPERWPRQPIESSSARRGAGDGRGGAERSGAERALRWGRRCGVRGGGGGRGGRVCRTSAGA